MTERADQPIFSAPRTDYGSDRAAERRAEAAVKVDSTIKAIREGTLNLESIPEGALRDAYRGLVGEIAPVTNTVYEASSPLHGAAQDLLDVGVGPNQTGVFGLDAQPKPSK